jgi:hypothetical protein
VAAAQLKKRTDALAVLKAEGLASDLYIGSPCLFCMQSYGKIPWHNAPTAVAPTGDRSLPVIG